MLSHQNLHKTNDRDLSEDLVPKLIAGGVPTIKDSRFVLLKPKSFMPANGVNTSTTKPSSDASAEQREEYYTPSIKSEHQKAFSLLEDVKGFIPKILRENSDLKQNLLELKSQAEAEIEAAELRSQEWKLSADSLKGQVDTLEAMVLDLRGKLQRAESIAAIEKELSSKVGQEAAEAECLAKLFEDTVIQSFGVGTMFEEALARIEFGGK